MTDKAAEQTETPRKYSMSTVNAANRKVCLGQASIKRGGRIIRAKALKLPSTKKSTKDQTRLGDE